MDYINEVGKICLMITQIHAVYILFKRKDKNDK